MFSLGHELINEIEFEGQALYLNASFDTVLRYFQLANDDDFEEQEKLEIIFDMFVVNSEAVGDVFEKVKVLEIILESVLGFELEKAKKDEAPGDAAPPIKTHDFEKDAGIIYASFLFDYNMDLFEQQGRLHWRQFISLFEHLSEESKMSKVIGYRTMKTPAGKGSSPEHRKHVIDMKRKYRLEPLDDNPDVLQTQLSGLFNSLKMKAEKAGV